MHIIHGYNNPVYNAHKTVGVHYTRHLTSLSSCFFTGEWKEYSVSSEFWEGLARDSV